MPFYEYECSACGHTVEVLQKISDPPLTECPACHAAAMTKLVSRSGFKLTGTGWYETDFKGGKKSSGTDTKSTSDASSSGSSSSDAAKSGGTEKASAPAAADPKPATGNG